MKTLMTVKASEVLSLLSVDLFVFLLVGVVSISNCLSAQNMIIVNRNVTCTLQFLINFYTIAKVMVAILIINLVLAYIWHFVVKKK